jgi:hypothetical protein
MLMGQRFDELTQAPYTRGIGSEGKEPQYRPQPPLSANSVVNDFGMRIFADRTLEPSLRYRLTGLCANVKNVLGQMSPGIHGQILVSAGGAGRPVGQKSGNASFREEYGAPRFLG